MFRFRFQSIPDGRNAQGRDKGRPSGLLILAIGCLAAAVPALAQEAGNEAWEAFAAEHSTPGLQMVWDPEARVPRSITGLSVAPPADMQSYDQASDILEISLAFLDRHADLLGLSAGDVEEKSVRKYQDRWYVQLQTLHRDVPIHRGQAGLTLDLGGRILGFASDYDPRIDLDVTPTIDRARAVELARRHHQSAADLPAVPREVRLVIDRGLDEVGEPRLAWYIFLGTQAGHPEVDRVFFLDAQSGELIRDYFPYPNAVTGTIRGQIFPEHSTDAVVTNPFEHVRVDVGSASATTGATGAYSASPGTGSHTLTTRLEGPFVKVQSWSGTVDQDVTRTLTVTDPGTADVTWTGATASPDDGDGLNVFYHANRLHDDYYVSVLGFNWNNPWTSTPQMTYSVNRGTANNAFAGNPVNIFSDAAARNSDITFHETTHNVLYDLFGGWVGFPAMTSEGYAFDEGFSDYVACSFNNDSTYAENVHSTRSCDNTMQYPGTSYSIGGHTGGQLVSGVVWDLWNREGMGHNAADRLAFKGLQQMATLPSPYSFSNPSRSNYFRSIRIADDNDNNLGNGTPNDRQIFQAFRNHDLLPVDVFSKDSPTDTGDVPSAGQHWTSPDIWVRNSNDALTTHQNPIFGQPNYIYVRVRNLGYLPASSITVRVYWADPASGIPWPSGWNLIGSTTVTNLAADSNVVAAAIPWTPSGSALGHRCLRVRLESSQDLMTEEGNVKLENNIAQKNITIIELPPSGTAATGFFVYNRPGARIDLGFELQRVRLGETDIPRPVEGRRLPVRASMEIQGLRGFAETEGLEVEQGQKQRFHLQGRRGRIEGLDLGSAERVRVDLDLLVEDGGPEEIFELTVEQRVDGEVFGGLTYLIRSRAGREKAWSFHGGIASPRGTFDTIYDNGLHVGLDFELRLRPRLYLVGLLGYSRFEAGGLFAAEIGDTYWWHLSADLKLELGTGRLRPWVRGGPGLYLPESGSAEPGFNLGLGLDYDLGGRWTLELGADYHRILTGGSDTEFSTTAVGLLYRF